MSFYKSATHLHLPIVPKHDYSEAVECYFGIDADLNFFAFRAGLPSGSGLVSTKRYVIAESFLPSVTIDSTTLHAVPGVLVNGYALFKATNGEKYFYYSPKHYNWVYVEGGVPVGADPLEEAVTEDGETTYIGDEFYLGGFPREGSSTTLEPRGTVKTGGMAKTATYHFPRWESKTQFGEYEPKGGAQETKYLGVPRFNLSDGTTVVRSVKKGNYFTYGKIHRDDDGMWRIGEKNSVSGWWEGDEPSVSASRIFTFHTLPDSDAEGEDIAVSFDMYIEGEETHKAYIGDLAIWR